MKARTLKIISLFILGSSMLIGCAPLPLTINKMPYEAPDVVRTRRYDSSKINSILVIQPASNRALENKKEYAAGTKRIILSSGKDAYVSYIETLLLKKGYTLISDDILVKIKNTDDIRLQTGERLVERGISLTPSELATKFGKQSGADAILKINKLKEKREDLFFIYYSKTSKWEEMVDEIAWRAEKTYLNKEKIKYTPFKLVLLRFSIDAEINDVETGNILAKGTASLSTRNVMPEDYTAFFNSNGRRKKENFHISKYVSLKTMDAQIKELIKNVISKLVDNKI